MALSRLETLLFVVGKCLGPNQNEVELNENSEWEGAKIWAAPPTKERGGFLEFVWSQLCVCAQVVGILCSSKWGLERGRGRNQPFHIRLGSKYNSLYKAVAHRACHHLTSIRLTRTPFLLASWLGTWAELNWSSLPSCLPYLAWINKSDSVCNSFDPYSVVIYESTLTFACFKACLLI